jgi:hypothetical protein
MAAATASVNGYLTSTDWTTFNNKGSGTVTSVSGTGTVNGITLTGTVTSSGSLTLGGTLSNVSLTTQVTGTLPVANGGTGATTLTSGYLVKGNGTSAVSASIVYDTGTNVGIGTTSPQQRLDVSVSGGSAFAGIRSQNSNSGSGIGGIEFSSDATYAKAAIGLVRGAANGVGTLAFYNASSTGAANWATTDERMRIDSSGNVGIGTTSPQQRLDVSVAGGSAFAGIRSQNSNSGSGIGGIEFSSDTTYSKAAIGILRQNANGQGSLIFYNASSAGAANWTTADERMRIDGNGNVGIGATANASAILDVQSTTKGFRLPNMTTVEKNAISSPAAGLMVFDTTLSKACVYSGAAWQTITSL